MASRTHALDDPASFAIPFAMETDGRYVAPAEAHGALSCPACKRAVEKRQRDLLDVPTFMHPSTLDCSEALEQVLAGRTRQVLAEAHQIRLPLWHRASIDRQDLRGRVHFVDVKIEGRTWDYSSGSLTARYPGLKADVAIFKDEAAGLVAGVPDITELVIEVKAVRGDNVFKSNLRIIHELQLDALEIDVSQATSEDYEPAAFAQFVTHRAPRWWLYNRGIEAHFERLNLEMLARYDACMTPGLGED